MNKLSDCELAKELVPGKRVFRIELEPGKALMIGAELEVDPGGMADFQRAAAGDAEIVAGIARAYALATNLENLRGGQAE